jgi:hypothetical protein
VKIQLRLTQEELDVVIKHLRTYPPGHARSYFSNTECFRAARAEAICHDEPQTAQQYG